MSAKAKADDVQNDVQHFVTVIGAGVSFFV